MTLTAGLLVIGTPQLPETGAFEEALAAAGFALTQRQAIRADTAVIKKWIRLWADQERLAFLATVGGIGLGTMDVTAEALREVIERDLSGIAAMMRMGAFTKTRAAALDRLEAGLRRRSIIVTFPSDAGRQLIYFDLVRHTVQRAAAEVGR